MLKPILALLIFAFAIVLHAAFGAHDASAIVSVSTVTPRSNAAPPAGAQTEWQPLSAPTAPPKLTSIQKSAAANAAVSGDDLWAVVTPSSPRNARASLVVEGGVVAGDAIWMASDEAQARARVAFVPATTSKRYLLDCSVAQGDHYTVKAHPGSGEQTFGAVSHVLVVIDVHRDMKSEPVTVTLTGSKGFWLYGCEITKT